MFCCFVLAFWSRQVKVERHRCEQKCKGEWYDGVGRTAPSWDQHSATILNSWSFCSLQKSLCAQLCLMFVSLHCHPVWKTPSEYTTVCAARQHTLLTLCQERCWVHAPSHLMHELWTFQQDMSNSYNERRSTDLSWYPLWFYAVGLCHRPLDAAV